MILLPVKMAVYDELRTEGTFYIFGTCLKFVPKHLNTLPGRRQ